MELGVAATAVGLGGSSLGQCSDLEPLPPIVNSRTCDLMGAVWAGTMSTLFPVLSPASSCRETECIGGQSDIRDCALAASRPPSQLIFWPPGPLSGRLLCVLTLGPHALPVTHQSPNHPARSLPCMHCTVLAPPKAFPAPLCSGLVPSLHSTLPVAGTPLPLPASLQLTFKKWPRVPGLCVPMHAACTINRCRNGAVPALYDRQGN